MACDHCKTGFKWDAATTGKDTTLNDIPAYVTGESKDAAILILTDIFGHTLPNVRILADHYAKETKAAVYVPDIFDGEVVHPDVFSDPKIGKDFDLGAFIGRHGKEARWPQIKAAAQTLKSKYSKVVAIGFCYGGWACFKLAADPSLIDAISTAHPSLLEKSEIDGVKVPVQLLVPEIDEAYTKELQDHTFAVLPKSGIPWEYVYFPGVAHGFACRGDPNNKTQRDGLERGKRIAVNFFNEFLH